MEKKSSSKFDFLKLKECPFCGSSYFGKDGFSSGKSDIVVSHVIKLLPLLH